MVVWAIWLQSIEVVFKGQMVSADGVEHTVGGFVANWYRLGGEPV